MVTCYYYHGGIFGRMSLESAKIWIANNPINGQYGYYK